SLSARVLQRRLAGFGFLVECAGGSRCRSGHTCCACNSGALEEISAVRRKLPRLAHGCVSAMRWFSRRLYDTSKAGESERYFWTCSSTALMIAAVSSLRSTVLIPIFLACRSVLSDSAMATRRIESHPPLRCRRIEHSLVPGSATITFG